MSESTPLCRLDDIPDGDAIGLKLAAAAGGADIILLRQGGQVFAYYNECPHAGRNLDYAPGRFLVRNGRITCAVHGASFKVDDGDCCGGPARSGLVPLQVEVVGDAVHLRATPDAVAAG